METAVGSEKRVLLIGLDDSLASELGKALSRLASKVQSCNVPSAEKVEQAQLTAADCVFCPSEAHQLQSLLQSLHDRCPGLPVIAVTRHPDDFEWIRAMDAGATDYCATPFEPRQVDWILQNSLRHDRLASVAAH